jgi:hypothetical protein
MSPLDQCEQALRTTALEHDSRRDVCHLAGTVEELSGHEGSSEQQESLVREFPDIDGLPGPEPMVGGDGREYPQGEERPPLERRPAGEGADGDVDGAALDVVEETPGTVLDELNLDVRTDAAIPREQEGDEALEGLRCGAQSEKARGAPRQVLRPCLQRFGVVQKGSTAREKFFPGAGEGDAPTDSIEQLDSELGLQSQDSA